ncbi:creatininase family protein [Rhodoplanes sp. Z2-YC6860]|uniref:creatininase family protein n=1 Tax=Rhodoplanes sp. Z2-YC6860 TaxID=674703 RepID=UPI00078D5143|nr:creatininase family protein [Rhodoplanes sp. Z2-YC6860]AMN41430.1 creatinine amidohydrolase [Rhodoplanes sp. Z2-YC6860]
MAAGRRALGHLTFQEVRSSLRETSILCLPMGSMEQHGPHLPLNTDSVLAEALTGKIVERWGETLDLWQLPVVSAGLSREHDWAPGTLSLSISGMTAYLRDLGREIARSLPTRNLLIVNGHGGNRGILEALGREFRADFGLNVGTLHLGALISPVTDAAVPEIHAGRDETSAMLALAPELVRKERLADTRGPSSGAAIHALVLDPATSWPWSSDDKRIAEQGVIGDARDASVEHGQAIVSRVVDVAGAVLRQLRENRKA